MKTILLNRVLQGALAVLLYGSATLAMAQVFDGAAWSVDIEMEVDDVAQLGFGEKSDRDSSGQLALLLDRVLQAAQVVEAAQAVALYDPPTTATAQGFEGVEWSVDTEMEVDAVEEMGCGDVPDPDSSGPLTFSLRGCESGTQRQEFKYPRREGFHRMTGQFTIDERLTDFSAISVAQTHDNGNGSEGVFTIYRVTKRDGQFYFSAQGDYFNYDEVDDQIIYPGRTYGLVTTTYSDGASSYEYGELYEGGNRIWELWTTDGGADLDDESDEDASKQYKKIGVYQLSEGYGAISVDWENVEFFIGRR